MPISKDKLAQIIANSSETIRSMEERGAQKNVSRGKINETHAYGGPSVSDYDADADMWDRLYLSDSDDEQPSNSHVKDIQYSDFGAENSSMPENIKKSMLEHRIDTSALSPNASVLRDLNIQTKPLTGGKKQQIAESMGTPNANYQAASQYGGGVDYSIIKAIVSECIREYFSSKNALNENALSNIVLKNGTIGLIDNSGNVYRARLEKVDKKKQE